MANQQQTGLLYGLTAYILWGFFPIFFFYLSAVSPAEILAQRIIWSFLFLAIVVLITGKHQRIWEALRNPATRKFMIASSILIAINWLTFIWAVANERVLESSFGYFLTPLVSVMLARVILKEQLDNYRLAACALALIGIITQVINLGGLPWVSLTVSISFGCYGLVRKKAEVDSLSGLTIETAVLLPLSVLYVVWLAANSQSGFISNGTSVSVLLMVSGVITAVPLLLFATAAKKLSLTAIGFMMYINPIMQMLCGIFFFKESFDSTQLVSFGFIWVALIVFSVGAITQQRRMRLLANPIQ